MVDEDLSRGRGLGEVGSQSPSRDTTTSLLGPRRSPCAVSRRSSLDSATSIRLVTAALTPAAAKPRAERRDQVRRRRAACTRRAQLRSSAGWQRHAAAARRTTSMARERPSWSTTPGSAQHSPDFGARVIELDGDAGETTRNHSTHVAGTVGGNGANSNGNDLAGNLNGGTANQRAGMAPSVNICSFGSMLDRRAVQQPGRPQRQLHDRARQRRPPGDDVPRQQRRPERLPVRTARARHRHGDPIYQIVRGSINGQRSCSSSPPGTNGGRWAAAERSSRRSRRRRPRRTPLSSAPSTRTTTR